MQQQFERHDGMAIRGRHQNEDVYTLPMHIVLHRPTLLDKNAIC
jgi:hypothetical protein